jgi:hypothetical protein
MVRYGLIAARSLPRQPDETMFEIDRKTLRGGKTVYRAVGILVLDTKFLRCWAILGTPELAISGPVAGL